MLWGDAGAIGLKDAKRPTQRPRFNDEIGDTPQHVLPQDMVDDILLMCAAFGHTLQQVPANIKKLMFASSRALLAEYFPSRAARNIGIEPRDLLCPRRDLFGNLVTGMLVLDSLKLPPARELVPAPSFAQTPKNEKYI
eukprot:GEMP01130073.1.p2 GENE.GEMP01130073.1~~GEMP01130073.1.p2  ORF type:complete len:138 (+),score=35.21 GEMP01130073.1:53-466(+)